MMNAIANDDDFAEIFREEAGEVFQTMDKHLPVWRRLPTDMDALTEIRRCFHTLKGSGRMVNALDLADVAWKVENMLNRAIDGSAQVTEPVVELVSTARDLMPRMLDTCENRRLTGSDSEVEFLMAQADALAVGREPVAEPVAERAQATIVATISGGKESQPLELAMLNRRLERLQKRSDEALHRSEMALQLARRIAGHIGTMKGEARDRVGRAEVSRIIEQVARMGAEVRELRREAKHSEKEQPTQLRELNQLIDRRIRERVAPIESQRSDIERKLDEAYHEADASRSLARFALILSVLVGTGAVAALLM